MENFDELLNTRLGEDTEARRFTLRGVVFTLTASFRPELLAYFNQVQVLVAEATTPADVEAVREAQRAFMREALSTDADMEAWDRLAEVRGDSALTTEDMLVVLHKIVERATGRPPTRVSPSGETSEPPASTTASKVESSSPVAGSKA